MIDLIKLAQEYKALNLPNCPELRRQMLVKIFNPSVDKECHHVAVSGKPNPRKQSKRSQNIA